MNRQLTIETARRLFITRQRLSGERAAPTADGLLDIFQALGCIQIDPLKPVAETQRLVAHSRLGAHSIEIFNELQNKRKDIFEYWAHAASFVLSSDYPIHRRYFERVPNSNSQWRQKTDAWIAANANFQDFILSELKDRGPLQPKDIDDRPDVPSLKSTWSSSRSVTNMLHFMWQDGMVGVAYREGNRKYWDLMARCLPEDVSTEDISQEEMVWRSVCTSLRALGLGTVPQIKQHFTRGRYPAIAEVLKSMRSQGEIEQIEIQGDPKFAQAGPWYLNKSVLDDLEAIEKGQFEPRTELLSPV